MITQAKSRKHSKKHRRQKHSLVVDVGKPLVPLTKSPKKRRSEKLEDWIDAP